VWLLVDLDRLAARQRASAVPRPRLAGGSLEEEIRILAARRAARYARLADVRFDNSPPDVAEQARLLAARLTDRPAPA
jgi:shikimate kinase